MPDADSLGILVDELHIFTARHHGHSEQFSQIAGGGAPHGAPHAFPDAAPGGTVPAVPNETPKDRRRRIIGTNITRFREAGGLSKNELARRLAVDRGSVVRWESGRWEPSPDHLEELAEALDVPVHEFYVDAAAA
jgi:DNA-binding XRE family transcriptional regulator